MPDHNRSEANDMLIHEVAEKMFKNSPQQGPKLKNRHGHEFGRPFNDGYATCSRCGCREDSHEAASMCFRPAQLREEPT